MVKGTARNRLPSLSPPPIRLPTCSMCPPCHTSQCRALCGGGPTAAPAPCEACLASPRYVRPCACSTSGPGRAPACDTGDRAQRRPPPATGATQESAYITEDSVGVVRFQCCHPCMRRQVNDTQRLASDTTTPDTTTTVPGQAAIWQSQKHQHQRRHHHQHQHQHQQQQQQQQQPQPPTHR